MTQEERREHNNKVEAEIAKLIAETSRLNAIRDPEIAHLKAITSKLLADVEKSRSETKWYLLVVGSGATLAIVAVAKLFL